MQEEDFRNAMEIEDIQVLSGGGYGGAETEPRKWEWSLVAPFIQSMAELVPS